jgi:hypothetical protein
MSYNRLFIFIEGDDDERFFKNIIVPQLHDKYDSFGFIKYQAERSHGKEYIIKYLDSIYGMGAHYFFVADINSSPCVPDKKQKINQVYKDKLVNDQIVVVIKEIEGWYYAGVEDSKCDELNIRKLSSTDELTKEDFGSNLPNNYTHLQFMIEILKYYSLECATNKNKSFKYFLDKHVI